MIQPVHFLILQMTGIIRKHWLRPIFYVTNFCRGDGWVSDGCHVDRSQSGSNFTVCNCYHLTTFALLMSPTGAAVSHSRLMLLQFTLFLDGQSTTSNCNKSWSLLVNHCTDHNYNPPFCSQVCKYCYSFIIFIPQKDREWTQSSPSSTGTSTLSQSDCVFSGSRQVLCPFSGHPLHIHCCFVTLFASLHILLAVSGGDTSLPVHRQSLL